MREFLVKWHCSWDSGELVIRAYDQKQLRKKFKKIARNSECPSGGKHWRLSKISSIEELKG